MKKLSKITEIVGLGVDLARLLTEDVKKMTFETGSIAYFLTVKVEKAIRDRKDEIRKKVMGVVRQKGIHHTDKTRRMTIYGDTYVDATTSTKVLYDESRIKAILDVKGLDRCKVFNVKEVEVFDQEAWQALVKLEVVSGDEAKSVIEEKRSYRLQVKPGAKLLNGKIKELLG